jgi:hypothetical protein
MVYSVFLKTPSFGTKSGHSFIVVDIGLTPPKRVLIEFTSVFQKLVG